MPPQLGEMKMSKEYWGVRNSSGGYFYSDSREKITKWLNRYNEEYFGTWKESKNASIENVTDFIKKKKRSEYFHEFNEFVE